MGVYTIQIEIEIAKIPKFTIIRFLGEIRKKYANGVKAHDFPNDQKIDGLVVRSWTICTSYSLNLINRDL